MKRLIIRESGKESSGRRWQNIDSSSDSESDDHHHHSSPLKITETVQSSSNGEYNEIQTEQDHGLRSAPVGSNRIAECPSIGTAEVESPPIRQDNDDNDLVHSSPIGSSIEAAEVESPTNRQGNNRRRISPDGVTMYRAAIQGDWLAAELLLSRNPNLATDYLTDEGDLALHVAAAMKHGNFVRKLVKWIKDEDKLLLRDGHGCTACCYAALSGDVQIAGVMIEKKLELVTTYDDSNLTPLHKAALRGNKGMLSFLLKSSQVEDLSNDAWFDILHLTIQEKMFDVAIELVKKNHVLATMAKDERTALHLLAQLDKSNIVIMRGWRVKLLENILGVDLTELPAKIWPSSFVQLSERLWAEMQKMEYTSLLEVIRKRHILHDAAKSGHAELVAMLIRSYPQLVLDTDSAGYTIFHIAVTYRQRAVFSLIHQLKAMIHTRIISRDKDGNNILHLAAKLCAGSLNRTKSTPVMLLREELIWFNMTKRVVPPSYQDMRNNDGMTPRELFSKTHKRMLNDSKAWMMNSADSYMLIATILISVVFAAAFSLPGGYDPQTGKPILVARTLFNNFLTYELYSLTGSVISILFFRSIMTSRFAEVDFLIDLPRKIFCGFHILMSSLLLAVSAFMSSFELVGRRLNHGDMLYCILILYGACILCLLRELAKTFSWEIVYMLRRSTLFDSFPPAPYS